MQAAAVKSQYRAKKKKVVDVRTDKSIALIQLEQRQYKRFIEGINSINTILDEHNVKQKKIVYDNYESITKLDRYIFRPDGNRKIAWDIWTAALILYSIVSIPLKIGFQINSDVNDNIFDYIIDCFFFIDIIATFNTAVVGDNDKFISNRTAIALRYLSFWFWIDLVSTIPIDTIVELAFAENNGNALTAIRLIRIIRLIRLIKLARIFRLRNMTEHLESLRINPAILNVTKLIFQIFFIAHIISCFWYFLTTSDVIGYNDNGDKQSVPTWVRDWPSIDHGTLGDKYVASLHWCVATMVAVGYGDIHAENMQERIFSIFVMLSGGIMFGAIIGETTRLVESRNPQAKLMKEKLNNLKGYFSESPALTLELRVEAKTAYTYYLTKDVSLGDEIFNDLPFSLSAKLLYNIFDKEIACINIFHTSDKLFVIRLLKYCQPIFSKTGDVLYNLGDVTNEFVFIMKGLVTISSVTSDKTSMLVGYASEGNYFMDFEFLMNTLCLARYQVVEQSHLFVIKYAVMAEAMSDFTESGSNLQEDLQIRYKNFKEVLQSRTKALSSILVAAGEKRMGGITGQKKPDLESKTSPIPPDKKLLFWVDGYPRDSFDRHQIDNEVKSINDSNDSNILRIIIKNSDAQHELIEIPRNELIMKRIINPNGTIKLRWDGIMGLFILYSVLYIPVQIAFGDEVPSAMSVFEYITDAFFVSDILVTSRTAYFDDNEDALMADPIMIMNHYLKSWFFIDFFSGVPFDSIVVASVSDNENLSSLKLIKIIRLMRLLKLMRLFKLTKFIYKLEDSFDVPPSLFELMVLILRVLFLGHFIACFWWGMCSIMSDTPWFTIESDISGIVYGDKGTDEKYIASMYWTFATLATVGYGDIIASNTNERLLNVFIMLIGATTFGYIVANVAGAFGSLNLTQVLKREKITNISSMLTEKNVKDGLSKSIIDHFKILYKKLSAYDEEAILRGLPQRISNKICILNHRETMMKIRLFNFIDNQSVALYIFNLLQPYNFQPGQIIMKEDTAALEIVFLTFGTAIACKLLKGAKKQSYLFNWETAPISKSSRVHPESTRQPRNSMRRSSSSHVRRASNINASPVIDRKRINSVVPSSSSSPNSPHSDDDDDDDYNHDDDDDGLKILSAMQNSSASGSNENVDFTDEEMLELGFEPLVRYSEGDFFGHSSLLKETNYNASVVAMSTCNTYVLKKSELLKLITNNPPISMILQSAIGKAIHSLRKSKGKEAIIQERANFLANVKSKFVQHKKRRKMFEEAIIKELSSIKAKSIKKPRVKPIRFASFKNLQKLRTFNNSKWELVHKAMKDARAAATSARMADSAATDKLPAGSSMKKRDDYFKRAIAIELGAPLDTVLNSSSMIYDSSDDEEEKANGSGKGNRDRKLGSFYYSDSPVRARARISSGSSLFLTTNNNSLTTNNSSMKTSTLDAVKEDVNLHSLKKLVVRRNLSLSRIGLGDDDMFKDRIENENKSMRRASFPSFDYNEWKRNRIDNTII